MSAEETVKKRPSLTDWARRTFKGVLQPIARVLLRVGLTPNAVTLLGLAGNAVGALFLSQGLMTLGGLIILLMAIELMLLAVNMNFVAFSYYLNDMAGQIFVFFILTVAAAESAIGLAILVLLFRNKSSINVDELNTLKG